MYASFFIDATDFAATADYAFEPSSVLQCFSRDFSIFEFGRPDIPEFFPVSGTKFQ